jgi:hypothetical protein
MGKVVDALGAELNVGDKIAYAVGAGRSQVLNFYQIDTITSLGMQKEWDRDTKKYVDRENFTVRGLYLGGHAWRSGSSSRKYSTLYFTGERAVKLSKNVKLPQFAPDGGL